MLIFLDCRIWLKNDCKGTKVFSLQKLIMLKMFIILENEQFIGFK